MKLMRRRQQQQKFEEQDVREAKVDRAFVIRAAGFGLPCTGFMAEGPLLQMDATQSQSK
jgi:hypothetical protein